MSVLVGSEARVPAEARTEALIYLTGPRLRPPLHPLLLASGDFHYLFDSVATATLSCYGTLYTLCVNVALQTDPIFQFRKQQKNVVQRNSTSFTYNLILRVFS